MKILTKKISALAGASQSDSSMNLDCQDLVVQVQSLEKVMIHLFEDFWLNVHIIKLTHFLEQSNGVVYLDTAIADEKCFLFVWEKIVGSSNKMRLKNRVQTLNGGQVEFTVV